MGVGQEVTEGLGRSVGGDNNFAVIDLVFCSYGIGLAFSYTESTAVCMGSFYYFRSGAEGINGISVYIRLYLLYVCITFVYGYSADNQ